MKRIISAFLLLLPNLAFAEEAGGSVSQMAKTIYEQPGYLVIATGLVVGFATVISGVHHFKNTALSKMQHPASEGFAKIGAGVAMLAFTFVYSVLKTSFFTGGDTSWNNDSNPLSIEKSIMDTTQQAENSFIDIFTTNEFKAMVFGILWLIGLIFIFVGLYKFKNVTTKKEGAIKEPIIQVIGGIACMNPIIALCLLAALGPGFLCPTEN